MRKNKINLNNMISSKRVLNCVEITLLFWKPFLFKIQFPVLIGLPHERYVSLFRNMAIMSKC